MRSALAEVAFDDAAGAKKNNAYWMQGGHSQKVALGVTLQMRKEQCILDAESTCGKWLFDGALVRLGERDSHCVLPGA